MGLHSTHSTITPPVRPKNPLTDRGASTNASKNRPTLAQGDTLSKPGTRRYRIARDGRDLVVGPQGGSITTALAHVIAATFCNTHIPFDISRDSLSRL